MNRSVADLGGGVLVVSQFTLLGRLPRRSPAEFHGAADPADAERLYLPFADAAPQDIGVQVETGVFPGHDARGTRQRRAGDAAAGQRQTFLR